jgi:hypothetical protein
MSNLSHHFKKEHADKTLFVPGGSPSQTVTADTLTQKHIDAFDEETKAFFFDAVSKPAKEKEKEVGKQLKGKQEAEGMYVEQLRHQIDELQKKYDAYSPTGRKGKQGQETLKKLEQLKSIQSNQSKIMENQKNEWDPQAPHTLDEIKNRIADLRQVVNLGGGSPEMVAEIEELGKQVNILTSEMAQPNAGPTINAAGQINAEESDGDSDQEGEDNNDKDSEEE